MTDSDLDFCHNSLSNKPGSNKTFMMFHTMNIHPRGIPIRHKAPCIIQDMVLRKCKLSTLLNAFKERSCTHRTSSSNHAYNVHNGVLEPGRQDGEHCSCPYFFCFSKVSEIRLGKPQTWTPPISLQQAAEFNTHPPTMFLRWQRPPQAFKPRSGTQCTIPTRK